MYVSAERKDIVNLGGMQILDTNALAAAPRYASSAFGPRSTFSPMRPLYSGSGMGPRTVFKTPRAVLSGLGSVPPAYANAGLGPRSKFFAPQVVLGQTDSQVAGATAGAIIGISLLSLAISFGVMVGASYLGARLALRSK